MGRGRLTARLRLWLTAIAALAFSTAIPAAATASPGDLDPSFGLWGTVSVSPLKLFDATAVHTSPAGTTVVGNAATYFTCNHIDCEDDYRATVVRYTPDGELDTDFGDGGIAQAPRFVTAKGQGYPGFQRLLVTTDGNIFMASAGDRFGGMLHFTADGIFDADFPATPRPLFDVESIAEAPDGKLIVSGLPDADLEHPDGWPPDHALLTRLLPDGSVDPDFGSDGFVDALPAPEGEETRTGDVSVAADGSITLTAEARLKVGLEIQDRDAVVARFHPDGSPDTSFGDGGSMVLTDGTPGELVPAGGGKWLLGVGDGLVEFNDEGELVSGFGQDGVADADSRYGLGVDEDGDIYTSDSSGLERRLPNGQLDLSFGGGDGRVGTPWFSSYALDVQPNGRVARVGKVFGAPESVAVLHGNQDGPADSDADGLGDDADQCFEVSGDRLDGCPLLNFEIELSSFGNQRRGDVYRTSEPRSFACRRIAGPEWVLIRRWQGEVTRYRVPHQKFVRFRGPGRYRVHVGPRLLPERGYCPALDSNTVVIRPDSHQRAR